MRTHEFQCNGQVYYSTTMAADILGVSRTQFYNIACAGTIVPRELTIAGKKRTVYLKRDVEKLITI